MLEVGLSETPKAQPPVTDMYVRQLESSLNIKGQTEPLFERFIYDPGIFEKHQLKDPVVQKLKLVDPGLSQNEVEREGVKILNKKSVLEVAQQAVFDGHNIGFVKFDVKYLRLVDKAGYADVLLRDLAEILNKVAKTHQADGVLTGRTGGDSFCFLVVADKVQESLLKKMYDEVEIEFKKKKAFYLIEDPNGVEDKILPQKATLKHEKDVDKLIFSKDISDGNRLLRALLSGRLPDKNDLLNTNVSSTEIPRLKSRVRNKMKKYLPNNDDPKKRIDSFKKNHPELNEQVNRIQELYTDGVQNYQSINRLISIMEDYYIDPLFEEEVFLAPDYVKHLQAREGSSSERIAYDYMPWLKNLNTRIGENQTDELIKVMYRTARNSFPTKKESAPLPRARKDGGDFIFLPTSVDQHKDQILYHEIANQKIHEIFKEYGGIPSFVAISDYPKKGVDVGVVLDNMKAVARQNFISWLNYVYQQNSTSAKVVLDFYLEERTGDRCRELLSTAKTMKHDINEDMKKYLEERFESVQHRDREEILKFFSQPII